MQSIARMTFMRSHPQRMVATVGSNALAVCNVLGGSVLKTIESNLAISGLLIDPAGRWAVANVTSPSTDSGVSSQGLRAWDLKSGALIFEALSKDGSDGIKLFDVSDDGRYVLLGSRDYMRVDEVSY